MPNLTDHTNQISSSTSFESPEDIAFGTEFCDAGYVIRPVEDTDGLARISEFVAEASAREIGEDTPANTVAFLDAISHHVTPTELNAFRLNIHNVLNQQDWLGPAYFSLARHAIENIVGNELAMQRRINLSIQLPNDTSSLLPIHADVFNGDSPYEVVLWVPLVDCYSTKSMFILPPGPNGNLLERLPILGTLRSEEIYRSVEGDIIWLDVPYGSYLLFSQNLFHGNRVNEESDTRWSLNCRFKALLTPYADKKLGEFFKLITMRPATRLGQAFKVPDGFSG